MELQWMLFIIALLGWQARSGEFSIHSFIHSLHYNAAKSLERCHITVSAVVVITVIVSCEYAIYFCKRVQRFLFRVPSHAIFAIKICF